MHGGAGGDESPGPDDDARHHPTDPAAGAAARSDAELIEAVRTERPATGAISPTDAFAELYARHVDAARALARHLARSGVDAEDLVATAFARLLEAMRAGRGPTEAFRAYLLTSVRHLAYDRQRAERRVDLTDDLGDVVGVDPERTVVPFADPALAGLERTLAARAFATLPERWQAVLWHLEVEGDAPADIAPLFGLTANAVSALAYRAREGLRQAYLQEHLSSSTGRHDRRHRETEQRLGAYTRGGLAKRDAARVEAHLAECAECRALASELREVNSGLVRSVVAPLVLGAGLVGYLASRGSSEYLTAMWDHGSGQIDSRPSGAVGVVGALVHPSVLLTLLVTAPGGALAAAAAGVVGVVGAAGVVGALTVGDPGAREPAPVAAPPAPAVRDAPRATPSPPRDRPAPSPLTTLPPWADTSGPDTPPTTTRPGRSPGAVLTAPPATTTVPTTPLPAAGPPTVTPTTTPIPTRTTTPRSSDPRSAPAPSHPRRTAGASPDRSPPAPPGDDHPTRPLPLLDALGHVLVEVVPHGG